MAALVEQVTETADRQSGTPRHTASSDAKSERRTGGPRLATTTPGEPSTPVAMNSMARNRRRALLARVVEAEILPRLAAVRGAVAFSPDAVAKAGLGTEDNTSELVHLLLMREAAESVAFMQVLEERGSTPATLYLGVVTQAARRLGELWEDDRADFTQVTISMGRLQQVVRAMAPSFQTAAVARAHPETVLLLAAPGGQHTFGLVILSEFFRRDGWHVLGGPAAYTNTTLGALVQESWVDVAGFSIGSTGQLEALTKCIGLVRRLSRNRDLGVMVGGPLFLLRPDLVVRVGADMGACDAETAVRQASGLLAIRTAAD